MHLGAAEKMPCAVTIGADCSASDNMDKVRETDENAVIPPLLVLTGYLQDLVDHLHVCSVRFGFVCQANTVC